MDAIAQKPSCRPRGTWCRDARSTPSRVPSLGLRRRKAGSRKTLLAWVLGLTAVASVSTAIVRAAGLGF